MLGLAAIVTRLIAVSSHGHRDLVRRLERQAQASEWLESARLLADGERLTIDGWTIGRDGQRRWVRGPMDLEAVDP
jgi:hypothetical protein